jgi:thiosulfate dehydrogenase [quinone] large subunit
MDDHILGAISLVTLALLNAGNAWGLGRWWSSRAMVQRYPVLK